RSNTTASVPALSRLRVNPAPVLCRDPDFEPQPRGVGSHEQIYAVRCERALEGLAAVVFDWAEQRAVVLIEGVAGCIEIVVNESIGARMEREISRLLALAGDPQMRDAAARLVKILDLKLAEFVAAQRVKQQRRQDSAIALLLQGCLAGSGQQLACFVVAQCRRLAFAAVGLRPLDALDRIVADGVLIAKIFEKR